MGVELQVELPRTVEDMRQSGLMLQENLGLDIDVIDIIFEFLMYHIYKKKIARFIGKLHWFFKPKDMTV